MKRLLFVLSAAACAFAQASTPPAAAPAGGAALPDGLYAIFNTDKGVIKAQLFEKETPLTVANFVGLAKGTKAWMDPKTKAMVKRPKYNNIPFYRVIMDGMIQAGGDGVTPCGVHVKDEIRPDLKFDKPGRLAMANRSEPNSAECEWFITQVSGPQAAAWDGSYTIFGQVVEGQEVVKAISRVPAVATIAKNPAKLITLTIQRVGPAPAAPPPAKKSAPATKKK
jgi:peptidyl-prolyl cis-trans isomerase A (cyclophilin A)